MRKIIILSIFVYSAFLYAREISYFSPVVDQAGQAVARVEMYEEALGDFYSRGSGFFVRDSNTFVTNAHVIPMALMDNEDHKIDIQNFDSIRISQNGESYRVKGIRHLSVLHDLSVLEVEGYNGPVLELGEYKPDEDVYIIGFPRGEFRQLKTHFLYFHEEYLFYGLSPYFTDYKQLDGMSGGVAVNAQGNVVGVVSYNRRWYVGVTQLKFLEELLKQPVLTGDLNHAIEEQIHVIADLAENGDVLAQYVLGDLFLSFDIFASYVPLSVEDSLRRSEREFQQKQIQKWNEKAALQGHMKAGFDLGLLYLDGRLGMSKEESEKLAFDWIKRSALAGYPHAMFMLGSLLYKKGTGTHVSEKEAFEWTRKAALKGHPRAGFELALMFLDGYYVEPSAEKAVEWFEIASSRGNTLAQFTLGLIFYVGAGVEQSFSKAFEYFHIAGTMADHDPSQFILGAMYARGLGVERNAQLSQRWLAQSMIDGRFGFYADQMGGVISEDAIPSKREDLLDYLFIQIVISDPLDVRQLGLKDIVNVVRIAETLAFSKW